ncbi:MAG TPA: hypothetical protein VM717_00045 [Chthoniobacterales bacterium]|jgi:2'-5' RNA ligase|nr:hypothetical protein [Chthoniobacterales bacterium]
MKKTATVYWLLPAKPERELFRKFIRILRKEFGAPNFEPHLTLLVTAKDRPPPRRVLRQIRSRLIRLSARGIGYSPKFTKTLFVRFKSSLAMQKLVADLAHVARSAAKVPSDPHLSLLYKKMPCLAKKELASVIKLPFRTAAFDSVAAVRLTMPVRSAADVEKWRIVAKKWLHR